MTQQEQMQAVIDDIGMVQSVIVNVRSHSSWGPSQGVETLVDGHLRVSLALSEDEETMVPVTYVDLTPEEERRILLTFDPLSALAGTDDEKLAELVAQVAEEMPIESEMDVDAIVQADTSAVDAIAADTRCACCREQCAEGCGCYRGV